MSCHDCKQITSSCGHSHCRDCLKEHLSKNDDCPTCGKTIWSEFATEFELSMEPIEVNRAHNTYLKWTSDYNKDPLPVHKFTGINFLLTSPQPTAAEMEWADIQWTMNLPAREFDKR